jgi:hypothetical protein
MNHWISLGTQTFSSRFSERSMRRIMRSWSSESMIWKPCVRPASRQWMRKRRCDKPWNVPIQRLRVGTPSRASTRSRISAAALFVNVTASTCCAATPPTRMTHAIRCTSTRVLPLPAPASTSVGWSGAVTASRCAGFKGSMMSVTSIGSRGVPRAFRRSLEQSHCGQMAGM